MSQETPLQSLKLGLEQLFKITTPLSFSEVDRCLNDLEEISKKLSNNYYKSSDFSKTNVYHHKSKTSELFEFFLGYYERSKRILEILSFIPSTHIHSALDLCSGWSPKVEFALRDWGFYGHLYLLDSNPEPLNNLQQFIEMVRVDYEMESLCCDLFSNFNIHVDLVIANHVVDDLLLDDQRHHYHFELDQLYGSESLFKKVATAIASNKKEIFEPLIERLAAKIQEIVNANGYVIFLHYPGKLEQGLALYNWVTLIYDLMDELRERLIQKGFHCIKKNKSDSFFNDTSQSFFVVQKL